MKSLGAALGELERANAAVVREHTLCRDAVVAAEARVKVR